MEHTASRPMVNDVLVEAARLTHEERRQRIARCVTEGRHNPDTLPLCLAPSSQELMRYCDRCWSVIDAQGLTWSWPPAPV